MSHSNLQHETRMELHKLNSKSVEYQSATVGIERGEPLLFALDGMLRYAKAYRQNFGNYLSQDGFLGPEWLKVVTGLRSLLNGNGAVAMERNISTDSKSNGVCERVFWHALNESGYKEEDL